MDSGALGCPVQHSAHVHLSRTLPTLGCRRSSTRLGHRIARPLTSGLATLSDSLESRTRQDLTVAARQPRNTTLASTLDSRWYELSH